MSNQPDRHPVPQALVPSPPGLWMLSLLIVSFGGACLGGFFVELIRRPETALALEQIGKNWLLGFTHWLPWGERLGQFCLGSSLSYLIPYFPGMLTCGLLAMTAWLLLSLGAAWQNCLYFTAGLRRIGWALSPLLAFLPGWWIEHHPGFKVRHWFAVIPLAVCAFLVRKAFVEIQAVCLPDASRRNAPLAAPVLLPKALVWMAAGYMAFQWAWLSCLRHNSFQSQGYDLGLMSHVLNNFVTGKGLTSSLIVSGGSFLGHHFSPILLLISPLFFFCPHPEILLVIQAAALALAAVPLFGVACCLLGSPWAAAAMSLVYLCTPGLSEAAYSDFHAITLAPALMFWFVLECLRGGRQVWIPFFLVLLVQENLFIYTFFLSVFLALCSLFIRPEGGLGPGEGGESQGGRITGSRRAVLFAVLSIAYALLVFVVVQPLIQAEREAGYGFVQRYKDFLPEGASPETIGVGGLMGLILRHPEVIFSLLTGGERIHIFGRFWGGLAFLPVWNPLSWVALAPCLENSLSSEGYLYLWSGHYGIGPVMVTALASISSLALLKRWRKSASWIAPLAFILFFSQVLWSAKVSQLPFSEFLPSVVFRTEFAPAGTEKVLQTAIPPGKSVSAQSHLLPHLTFQDRLYLFPPGIPQAAPGGIPPDAPEFERLEPDVGWPDLIIYDPKAPGDMAWYNLWFYSREKSMEWTAWLVESGRYHRFPEEGSMTILEKVAPHR